MNFNSIWKSYLNEERDLELLIEGKLSDAKKKFNDLNERGFIDLLRGLIEERLGPRAVPKYIMWAAKHLDFQRVHENSAEQFLRNQSLVIADSLAFFENNQDRMPEKDINKYKSLASLVADVRQTGASQTQLRKQEKETAREGSEIVYDDNDIFAVRPYTEDASCYYGKNTRWCISATDSKNYFDQYTSDRKGFVMVRFNNIAEDDPLRRLAMVFDAEGYLEEVFDAQDEGHDGRIVEEAISKNNPSLEDEEVSELYEDLEAAGSDNIATTPPDPSAGFEAQADKLEEEYRDSIKHAFYHYDIDEYMYFGGGFEFEFDLGRFEGAEYQLPNYFSDRELEDTLREEGNLYGIDDIDISETGGTVDIRVMLNAQDYEPNPDGYDSFLSELSTMDDNYVDLKRIVEKYLVKEGYMMPSAFDAANEELADFASTLKNFELSSSSDEDQMVFTNSNAIPLDLPEGRDRMGTLGHGGMLNKLDIKIGGNPNRRPAYPGNNEFLKRLMKELQGLNRQFIILMQKQLQLPIADLPPRVIEELSIPDNLVVTFHGDHTGMNRSVTARVAFSLDTEVTREVIDASMAAIKFMDQSYKGIEKTISNVLTEMWREIQDEALDKFKAMPEQWQQVLTIAKTKHTMNANVRAIIKDLRSWLLEKGTGIAPGIEDHFKQLANLLKSKGDLPEDFELPKVGFNLKDQSVKQKTIATQFNPPTIAEEVERYLSGISEEKGRSRQRGIYKFYCMIGYTVTGGDSQRGLDDILADMRALPNVTIVTVVVANQRLSEEQYIAGLSIKFIPTVPGSIQAPENVKSRIVRDIRRIGNVSKVFKISTSLERIE